MMCDKLCGLCNSWLLRASFSVLYMALCTEDVSIMADRTCCASAVLFLRQSELLSVTRSCFRNPLENNLWIYDTFDQIEKCFFPKKLKESMVAVF